MKDSRKSLSSPFLIFIGESDHEDMSYGSLIEKIVRDAEDKGLKVQVFSEFPTQTHKAERQKLRNIPENFVENKKFLDEKFKKMGDLDGRRALYEQTIEENSSLTQEEFREKFADKIDFPEAREFFNEEAKKRDPNKILGVKDDNGFKNQESWNNFYWFGAALFHSEKIHGDMATDVRSNFNEESDITIIIAGSPHLPGLSKQLEGDFQGCDIAVISNPNQSDISESDRIHYDATPEALGKIGSLTGFEIDSSNEAIIPSVITEKIDVMAALKGAKSALQESAAADSEVHGANISSSNKSDSQSR